MRPATIITVIFLLIVSAGHLLRVVFQVPLVAGNVEVPIWMSAPAFIVTAALAIWLWTDNRKRKS